MIAVLGGLGAAVCWAGALLCASRATKLIAPPVVLAWVMLTGLVVVLPLALAGGIPENLDEELEWLVLAGVGNVSGLLFNYAALRVGMVSIVGPISSTEGAIAALLAIAAGETLGAAAGITLGVVALGVVLAARVPGGTSGDPLRAALLACAAAVCFGVGLYATARVSETLPLTWAILPARVIGVLVVGVPLVLMRSLRLPRGAGPLVIASGLFEIAGFAAYDWGRVTGSRSLPSWRLSSRPWPRWLRSYSSTSASRACSSRVSPPLRSEWRRLRRCRREGGASLRSNATRARSIGIGCRLITNCAFASSRWLELEASCSGSSDVSIAPSAWASETAATRSPPTRR